MLAANTRLFLIRDKLWAMANPANMGAGQEGLRDNGPQDYGAFPRRLVVRGLVVFPCGPVVSSSRCLLPRASVPLWFKIPVCQAEVRLRLFRVGADHRLLEAKIQLNPSKSG